MGAHGGEPFQRIEHPGLLPVLGLIFHLTGDASPCALAS